MIDVFFKRILVALDGSQHSFAALRRAISLSRIGAAEIVCFNAVDMRFMLSQTYAAGYVCDPTPMIDAMRDEGEAILASATSIANIAGLRVTTCVVLDTAVAATLATASAYQCDLIIMGTQGHSDVESLFLGNTTHGVLRDSTIPVLTVRAIAGEVPKSEQDVFKRALVAIDDSDPSDAAIDLAIAFAKQQQKLRLVFCSVVTPHPRDTTATRDLMRARARDLTEATCERASGCAIAADTSVIAGVPEIEILNAAALVDADLIVLGSHGRRGLQRLFLGSVAEHVVRHSIVPVLTVRSAHEIPVEAPLGEKTYATLA